jgi:hypothetical protein
MTAIEETIYVGPNLKVSTDETEIIDCLVDHGQMPKDFGRDYVTSFFVGDDLYLVLYFANCEDKGFHLYIISDFSMNVREMRQLSQVFGRLLDSGFNYSMMKQAKDEMDTFIAMAPTFRALLDKPELEEEYWG